MEAEGIPSTTSPQQRPVIWQYSHIFLVAVLCVDPQPRETHLSLCLIQGSLNVQVQGTEKITGGLRVMGEPQGLAF